MSKFEYLTEDYLQHFIATALAEDIGAGDFSTLSSVPASAQNRARFILKDEGVVAGLALAEKIFKHFDPELKVSLLLNDGDVVKKGDIGLVVEGSARSILSTERLVLNCAQRMSGIATLTRFAVSKLAGTKAKLLDTRKTTPNFRALEKWAVKIGGGENHRFGLFDMIMLKDNHVDYAGGIEKAIDGANRYIAENNLSLDIEIETRNLEEVEKVLKVGRIRRIMLDNMSLDDMRKAVEMIAGKYETEASGGITLETLRPVAETGVDFISMGALIHSHPNFDISLKAF
jgi:nicotinate-nucleotide pyrophosphorylase (carboxylating)